MTTQLPPREEWYCWREFSPVESCIEGQPPEPPRLLVPWADPHVYEYPFDFIYKTPELAREAKDEQAPEENWVLCKLILEPIEVVAGADEESE